MPAKADNGCQNGGGTDGNQRIERCGTSGAVATDDGEPKLLEMGGAGTGNGADGGSGNSDESGVLVDEKTNANLLPDRINNCVPDLLVSAGDLAGGGGNLGAVGVVETAQLVARKKQKVQPVAHPKLKLVQPVSPVKKQAVGATGGTKNKPNEADELQPPPIAGCEWRFTGYGWELWKRVPSISESGKRSSKRTYLAYYSRDAVKRLHDANEKKTNARTA